MSEGENLANIKAAYAEWGASRTKGNIASLEKIMADNFSVASMDESAPGLEFAVDTNTKVASIAYLNGIFEYWTMEYFRPDQFVVEGTRIAVFGWCKYVHKDTGNSVECRIANLWEFNEKGQIVSLIDIFDSAKAAAAATAR